ncbi:unnamed protein product [Meganyctiphanes norvegica]|uniref:TGF-beta family profile domain-containing protein n=1 Tax=Meganyctiphanes norvegica TaxID=48144 RepID=A0AAV2PR35_MEGNR
MERRCDILIHYIRMCLYLLALGAVGAMGAGLYVDDGNGRTVLADHLDAEETADLARHMLEVLDLPAPPDDRPRRHHHDRGHGSAPTWLKGVYDTLDDYGKIQTEELDDDQRATVNAADTIITFVTRDRPDGHPNHGANKKLYFDLSGVPLDHSILGAELRVYRHSWAPEPLALHVYMVTDNHGGEREVAQRILDKPGWAAVNITSPVLSWLLIPETNLGLRLSVTSIGYRHEQHFHEVGISGSHDEEDNRPFLVGFFGLPATYSKKKSRRTRSISLPTTPRRTYRSTLEHGIPDSLCQMKQLYVSFSDLGWEEWVIAPEGYDANYCEGRCEFPLQADMNATNHAIVQTLVKVIDGPEAGLPSACCAPTDLATIPVLYYAYNNKVVLKKYPKMIVKSCGCL